ncbi:MAG: GreA/GreB family elongation factor [Kiritimatiellae bacterium]|nr:GreA/GreB family elongation factor [Kiritimatiellia bacterium]
MADIDSMAKELSAKADAQDFAGAFELVRSNLAEFGKVLTPAGVRDALKKSTSSRTYASFVDAAEFGALPLEDSFARLEKLLSFAEGSLVLSKAWGLGKVKRIDDFYRRITVDFKMKRGHQFSYAAACDMIVSAPENHILVLREADPAAFEAMLKERKAEFVKRVVESYGGVSLVRLEDICVANGFVKKQNWKEFWEAARKEIAKDKCVKLPVKRTDPIEVKAQAEDYSDSWLTAFSHETDPQLILAGVKEYLAVKKPLTDAVKAMFETRLAFAVTAARKVNDALYARLASLVSHLRFQTPPAAEMRAYLKERSRFVQAAAALPASEVGNLVRFLADSEETRSLVYRHLPELCYAAVQEVIREFGNDPACRAAIGALVKSPGAPATLVALIAGRYADFAAWAELPPLATIVMHAIALGEGRQNGETLRMQNIVRRLFADRKWLEDTFSRLDADSQKLVFERFQASLGWESAAQHIIVTRMAKLNPELAKFVVKTERKKEYARLTSYRSFALKKQEYLKLINEDMPENIRKIEFAKGFGDLSENAEYQYAKDEQRALMQKQTLMQADLEAVKPSNFEDATCDEVMPGVMVTIQTDEGGKTYAILGEWDNDVEKGILSQKARLAENMLGKKEGDKFELPGAEGEVKFGIVKLISPLTQEIKDWMKLPEGVQI